MDARCDHCGLPVPPALADPAAERQFCCHGCRTVYAVLHEHGLDRYYDLVERSGDTVRPARDVGRDYDAWDDAAFAELYVRPGEADTLTTELYLEGVHCAACVWLIERAPAALPGLVEARLDLGRSLAVVRWDPAVVRLSRIARLIDSLGYPAHPYRGVAVREMRRREDRALLIRMAVAGAVAGNVMMMAFALYGGMLHGMEERFETLFRAASLAISIPAVFWSGGVFLRGAWGALRARALHMDVPISIGILAGFGWGAFNTLRGSGEIYFDSVTALIFLLLAGRYVQQKRQRASADAAELLYSLAPSSARVVDDAGTRSVPLETLRPGLLVEVRAGETVPVDGRVADGASSVDASLLTGESRPVPVAPGDTVHAGTTNLSSRLRVAVEAAGEATRVGRLMRMVEDAARRRAPIVQLADRISGLFVAAVLALAALTLVVWWGRGAGVALDHTIALLIVTCPCALGLATPLAVGAAIGRAGRAGILVKGGDAVERLARPGTILLDKTGTLTEGRTRLVAWHGDRGIGRLLAALESQVEHPVAHALVAAFAPSGGAAAAELPVARDVERAGTNAGVRGVVDGRRIAAGSPTWIASLAALDPHGLARTAERLASEGLTPVLVAADRTIAAAAGLGDPLRADAPATVRRLRAAGWRVGILSGDHPAVVAAVADRLGLERAACRGGVSPEGKLAAVEATATGRPVVMVGDGINDAAALSAADVGIAVHGGAEVAIAVADVFLGRSGVAPLAELLDGARRTMAVIRRNLVFSLCYNAVGAGLAMTGLIDPLVAAVLMPASSLTVITHSFRARTFDPPPETAADDGTRATDDARSGDPADRPAAAAV